MPNFKIVFGFVAVALLLTYSCKYEYLQESTVCFSRDVQPIIVANCTQSGCHNAVDREKGRDYSTYEGILKDVKAGSYKKSDLYQVIASSFGDVMPPSPYNRLSDDQILTIATWIAEGAGNDTCSVINSTCDTSGVISYATKVRPILQNNCDVCHAGTAQAGGGIVLSTYAGVKEVAQNTTLLGSIQFASGYSAMPKGGSKLSNCNIATIKKWVDAGAPNN